ncbi:ABC transporter permease [Corynebacterium falsenii]
MWSWIPAVALWVCLMSSPASSWLNTSWISSNTQMIWNLTVDHIKLAVPVIVLVFFLSIPIGYAAHRAGLSRRWKPARSAVIVATGILYGIPSLALFVVLPVILGTSVLSPLNVIVALLLYGLALQVRVVAEAFDAADPTAKLAATAIGYSMWQRFWLVDLPLAGNSIVAGMRVVAASTISLISVGALIGVSSLGDLLTAGFQRSFPTQILVGIVGIVVLAIVADIVLVIAGRLAMPWRSKVVA